MIATTFDIDNPRNWDPDHPSLKSPLAPHETAAVLRFHRTGRPGAEIRKLLKLKTLALMTMMREAMEQESKAFEDDRPIHDGLIRGK